MDFWYGIDMSPEKNIQRLGQYRFGRTFNESLDIFDNDEELEQDFYGFPSFW